MNKYTYYLVFIFFVFLYDLSEAQTGTGSQAVGTLLSVSTNQPCARIDKSSVTTGTGDTSELSCDRSTVLQLGIGPGTGESDANSVNFQFLAFPDSTDSGSTTFTGSGNTASQSQDVDCSGDNLGTDSCRSLLNDSGGSIMNIEIVVSPVIARYELGFTGLTIPYSYLYHSCPAQSTTPKANWNSCGQCPAPDPLNIAIPSSFFFKNNTDGSTYWTQTTLQQTALSCPGSAASKILTEKPPKNQDSQPVKDRCSQYENNIVFPRFINGTLGCGGTLTESGYDPTNPCSLDIIQTCTQPLQTQGSNGVTTNVCPGGPLQNFEQRNDNIYKFCCQSGDCAGSDDARCPLASGLLFSHSRCLMSGLTALESRREWVSEGFVKNVENGGGDEWDINTNDAQADTQRFIYSCQDCAGGDNLESGVVREPGTYYSTDKDKQVTVNNFEINLDTMTNDATCGCYLAGLFFNEKCSSANNVEGSCTCDAAQPCDSCWAYSRWETRYTNYPLFYDQHNCAPELYSDKLLDKKSASRWGSCIAGADKPGDLYTNKPATVSALTCFRALDPKKFHGEDQGQNFRLLLNPDGMTSFTGDSTFERCNVASSGGNVPTTPPRTCACNTEWYDTVVPLEPTCSVYSINSLAEPIFNITAKVSSTDREGKEQTYELDIGTITSGGVNGTDEFSTSATAFSEDRRVQINLKGIDYPKGSVSQYLEGFIVVCGDKPSFGNSRRPRQEMRMAHKTKNPIGVKNPWKILDEAVAGGGGGGVNSEFRYPLPSTLKQMQDFDIIDDAIFSQLGLKIDSEEEFQTMSFSGDGGVNYAWWYYVPKEKETQYGTGCNQNGFVSYGHYDVSSSSQVCSNRGGTCVPGYDLRDAQSTFSEAQLDPPTKQPCFVGREFVSAELKGIDNKGEDGNVNIPEFVPVGWNYKTPNYWVNENSLFSDSAPSGLPYYDSNNLRIRMTVGVEGTLLGETVSFSGGHLSYSNGLGAPVANQPIGDCIVSLVTLKGSAKLIAYNDGSQYSSSYSIDVSCDNDVAAKQNITSNAQTVNSGTFQLAPGGSSLVPIPIEITNVSAVNSASRFNCVASLTLPGTFGSGILSSLPIQCVATNNNGSGVGGKVIGGGPGPDKSGNYDPGKPDGQQDPFCESGFGSIFCDLTGWMGDIFGFVDTMAIFVGVIVSFIIAAILMCCLSYRIDDLFKGVEIKTDLMKATERGQTMKLREEIKEEEEIEKEGILG